MALLSARLPWPQTRDRPDSRDRGATRTLTLLRAPVWNMLGSNPARLPPSSEERVMRTRISRRHFHAALGWGAASIALSEFGLARPGMAEENFTLASTGATWGEGLRASFVDAPKFEEKTGLKVTQECAIDSVFTAKAMASCGNPQFSTLGVLQAEANFLALGGCLQDYDLDICTNYKDIIDSAKEPPRGQLN